MLFSLKQEAPASIGGGTFTAETVGTGFVDKTDCGRKTAVF